MNYWFLRLFRTACQGVHSSSLALWSDAIFCTNLRSGTLFVFFWHIYRKTSGLVKDTATSKSDLFVLVCCITRHCKRLNLGFLILNAGRLWCTVLVRILIIQILWAIFTEIVVVVTVVWCLRFDFSTLEGLFLVTKAGCLFPWAFIRSQLCFLLCPAESMQFDLLLDHFIHFLSHLTTLKESF